MEYRFSRNDIGQPIAVMNMEAEAFSHWLAIEVNDSHKAQLQKIMVAVDRLLSAQQWDFEYIGREFHLSLTRTSATVTANSVLQQRRETSNEAFDNDPDAEMEGDLEGSEWDEVVDFDDYHAEFDCFETESGLVASSGLEDFKVLIQAWLEYLEMR